METNKRLTRSQFNLIADVIRKTNKSFLVQKANARNQFWIDNTSGVDKLVEGKRYCFIVTVSTYTDNANNIRNKLRVVDFYEWESDIQEDAPTFIGVPSGTIENYIQTDITSLMIVEFTSDKGDSFFLRYFSDKEPQMGKCNLTLDLRSTSKLINAIGRTKDMFRKYINKDGVEVETRRWEPSLEITDIKYVE